MATAEDILKKSEARRRNSSKKFQPIRRRAWDYVSSINKPEELIPIKSDIKNRNENGNQYRNNISTYTGTNRNENGNQYRNNISTYINTNISTSNRNEKWEQEELKNNECSEKIIIKILRKTTGYQKKIMEQITAHIKSVSDNTNIIDIPIETLAIRIKSSKDIARTSIKRLQKKSILLKGKGERGRLGSTKIIVPNFIIKECINLFPCYAKSLDEISNEYRNKIENDNSVYNSSNLYINTTTNGSSSNLPEEWKNIDFEPLKEIGFSSTQISQLYSKNSNTPEVIQESINHFAFGLENNPKFKNYEDPLNVLMGVLIKKGGWHEKNYTSPKVKAEREMLAAMQRELEELKAIEEQKFDTAFKIWSIKLEDNEKENILNKYPKISESDKLAPMAIRGNLKNYFEKFVYTKKVINNG